MAARRFRHVGIFNLNLPAMGGGEKRTLVLAEHLSRTTRVSLVTAAPPDLPRLERFFGVSLERVSVIALGRDAERLDTCRRALDQLDFDLFINNSYQSDLPCPAPLGIYMCMFPHRDGGAASTSPTRKSGKIQAPPALASYSVVTANSRFTRRWIRRWWGRRSVVVYSACDPVGSPGAAAKEKVILHVGRFCAEDSPAHHKNQHLLVDAFRRLSCLTDTGWQLHLVGAVDPGAGAARYVDRLRGEAAGLPVLLHPNAELETVRDLYRRASIYWHATGAGFSEIDDPSRHEHFGVTVVEAMSAGAVPVVFDSGGSRETVRHRWNGYRWRDMDGLQGWTRRLAADPAHLERLGRRGRVSSARFSRDRFLERMDAVLAGM